MFDKNLCPIPRKYLQKNLTETANNWNFSKSKTRNPVKNCSVEFKIELDLGIIKINLFTNFYFSKYNLCKQNEQIQLQIIKILSL